jgi:Protein of unknown function (DUF4238)
VRRFLPRFYIEGFIDREEPANDLPVVWVHRPAIGIFQRTPIEPEGAHRHFNLVEEAALGKSDDLEQLLAIVEDDAARLIRGNIASHIPLAPSERHVLASFFAVLGIRLSSRYGDLDAGEARRGYDELLQVLREMGWVFWEADAPDYFISSDAPFHAAFPDEDGLVQGMELHAPGIEITLPLTPRLALHATWKRQGEIWRRAREDVLLEVNARTLFRARRFVLAPKPAIPG